MMELVSIVIITYNSAQYVIETLESAKNQNYKNLELIVSDDCSTDDTVEVCNTWLKKNKERFSTTKLITVKENQGVASNCNRGLQQATSNWIKFMAGDDLLLPNCIEDNMYFVSKNKNIKVLFSQIYKFTGVYNTTNNYQKYPSEIPVNLMNPSFSVEDQYKKLLLSDRITYTPSYFFNKQAILSVGGYDEKIHFIEDYPMWLKLTKARIQLFFMERVTVAYRLHEESLNASMKEELFSAQYIRTEPMRKKYVYPNLPWDLAGLNKFNYKVSRFFKKLKLTERTQRNQRLYHIATVYLNPFQYILSLKKHILKRGKKNIFYTE